MQKYLFLAFVLIVVYLLFVQSGAGQKTPKLLGGLGEVNTDAIKAFQGRG